MNPRRTTLSRHIIEEEHRHPSTTGEFSILLQQISFAARVLAHAVGRASLDGVSKSTDEIGPSGDPQKHLDLLADEIITDSFARSMLVAGIASEERAKASSLSVSPDAKYLLCLDPIDGSANSGVNAPLGTIFGIFRREIAGGPVAESDFLRPGREMVASGYVLYGPATLLVYSVGEGVHGFTLDREVGEFLLTHPNIDCPAQGTVLAANTSRYSQWSPEVQSFIDDVTGRPHAPVVRYSGAPVADLHRCLTDGGAFLYPSDTNFPNGKLRTLFEAAPLAFIAEHAGGRATTGTESVLDVVPDSLHHTTPIIIGSAELVGTYERHHRPTV